MENVKSSQFINQKLAGLGGALVGFLLAQYCGVALMVPVGIALVAFWLGRKVLIGDRRMVIVPLSVVIGHIGWMSAGAIYIDNWNPVRVDVLVLSAVGLWLVVAPAMAPLVVLAVLQTGLLFVNLTTLAQPEFGRVTHAALTAHIVMRVVCLAGVYFAAKRLRSGQSAPTITNASAAS